MALSLASLKQGTTPRPPMLLIYGTHGVGKTSLAASAPNPVFLQTEDGLGSLKVPTFGLMSTYGQILEAVTALYSEDHDLRTIILDSVDHTEPKIHAELCRRKQWSSIETPGYGRGYVEALDLWRELLSGLIALRDERGMTVIILAHYEIKRFESPLTEGYERYQPKMHRLASALLQETVDGAFFMNHRTSTVRDKAATGSKEGRARGVGGGTRVIFTEERPAFTAKRRVGLMIEPAPDSIDLPEDPAASWATLASNLAYFNHKGD